MFCFLKNIYLIFILEIPFTLLGYLSDIHEGSTSSSVPREERALGSHTRYYTSFSVLDVNGYIVGWALGPKAVSVCISHLGTKKVI